MPPHRPPNPPMSGPPQERRGATPPRAPTAERPPPWWTPWGTIAATTVGPSSGDTMGYRLRLVANAFLLVLGIYLFVSGALVKDLWVPAIKNGEYPGSDGGSLTIVTSHTDEYVSMSIGDTGVGMSREVKEKIFTPFFTNKPVGKGTGLGLPVTYEIVIAHGGSISVESEPGRWTRFEIRFPVKGPKGTGENGTSDSPE